MINTIILDDIIKQGLREDMHYCDLTTDLIVAEDSISKASVTYKEAGVVAGLWAFERVFNLLGDKVQVKRLVVEGSHVERGTVVLEMSGSTRDILKGERLALNLLQRMSGIATLAAHYASKVKSYPVKIVDTRKTTPGLRPLEKYAVTVGGCFNHRFNLSDGVMIKDNHIEAAGSITAAVEIVRSKLGHTVKIEVEVESLEQLHEALDVSADIIMLDNMDLTTMREAVRVTAGRAVLEASGGVNLDTVELIAETGVNVISVGALTHSARALDISLNIE